MESEILKQLKKAYPTIASQQEHLTEMISNFGSLSDAEMKLAVGEILCLAKLLYEDADDKRIVRNMQRQILDVEDAREGDTAYMEKLDYLKRCLTNFKPAIFRNLQSYFSESYHVDQDLVTCLPKITGQQMGAKVEIKRTPEDTNPVTFHIKTHQEFCSKSHPQLVVITTDGTGKVDFKELFIYLVLQYIGYGPKVHFIIDRDVTQSRIDEGILIATQDLGYTKRPEQRTKLFKMFQEVRDVLNRQPMTSIDESTRRDIIAIDMLSRALLLEDVIVNQGNFGIITVDIRGGEPSTSIVKWKILDFIPPQLVKARGDDYSYGKHYPGGASIFYSFKVGNISHTYDDEELGIINSILSEEYAKDLWLPALQQLTTARGNHLPLAAAMEKAFQDIELFMKTNQELLQIKRERLTRRMGDLARYRDNTMRNFGELDQGIRDYLKSANTAAPKP